MSFLLGNNGYFANNKGKPVKPLQRLPITPTILHKLCSLCSSLGPLWPSMRVMLTCGFFGMMRQSNLARHTITIFDLTRHTCQSYIILSSPGIIIIMKWSKTVQSLDNAVLLPIPQLSGQLMDPIRAYKGLLAASPTVSPNQPLLTHPSANGPVTITSDTLSTLLKVMLAELGFDCALYSLHSLRRGGATATYRQGVDILDIKCNGNWASEALWGYITARFVADTSMAQALAHTVTSQTPPTH